MEVKKDNEELNSLISSIQFDRWIFGFPTRFTLVSHKDRDHDPLQSSLSFPEPLIYSDNYTPTGSARRIYRNTYVGDGTPLRVKKTNVTPIGPKTLSRLTGTQVWSLHAFWWFIATKEHLVLFVGDLYVSEIPLLATLLEKVPNLDALVLVSYGGMNPPTHGVKYRDQLKNEIAAIAKREKMKGRIIYGLPHPLIPDWADRSAHHM